MQATLKETITYNAVQALPQLRLGTVRPKEAGYAWAERFDIFGRSFRFVEGLARKYAPGPLWITYAGQRSLLLLTVAHVRYVLERSPDPFAADPEIKKSRLSHFEPEAATIARGEDWERKSAINHELLQPMPVAEVVAEEVATLLDRPLLTWQPFGEAFERIARRLVLGDAAAADAEVSEWLAQLQEDADRRLPAYGDRFPLLMARIAEYVKKAEPGSLAGRAASIPGATGQLPHALFAIQDTTAINTYRALALIRAHANVSAQTRENVSDMMANETYAEAALQEAMRLFPTTPIYYRTAVRDTTIDGTEVPEGTLVIIPNGFHHRDRRGHPHANQFTPSQWLNDNGEPAGEDWAYNHFSHGPQYCTGRSLALDVAVAALRTLLGRRLTLRHPALNPDRPLPYFLNHFTITLAVH
ncbi:cytochrome P450 [Longispora albida]|uniref:cytochrome P450 n=1 Tax=Longispora albida TaxID=203523 RepID=UPI00036D358E|nr:cytochrome P450 [Longispora albida]